MAIETYIIGRSKQADIIINQTEASVSNLHLELTKDTRGKYYITDRKSTNGSYRKNGGRWIAIQQSYVKLDDRLLLGKYLTSVEHLLSMRLQKTSSAKAVRNPETGDIIAGTS
jgi:pSer/pThr/pTyr-binding forkhead associated (FHA) protein